MNSHNSEDLQIGHFSPVLGGNIGGFEEKIEGTMSTVPSENSEPTSEELHISREDEIEHRRKQRKSPLRRCESSMTTETVKEISEVTHIPTGIIKKLPRPLQYLLYIGSVLLCVFLAAKGAYEMAKEHK
jgi:hypothetical protein